MGLKFFFSSFILHSTSKYLVRYRFSAVKITAKGYVSLDRLICFFAYFVLFCVQKKEGRWFLSTKVQIPLTFTCAFPRTSSRLDTFQFFRRKLLHLLENLHISCKCWEQALFLYFQAHILFVFLISSSKFKEINILIKLISYNYDRKSFQVEIVI